MGKSTMDLLLTAVGVIGVVALAVAVFYGVGSVVYIAKNPDVLGGAVKRVGTKAAIEGIKGAFGG